MMPRACTRRGAGWLGWGVLLAACGACNPRGKFERYVPPPDGACRALQTALDAWQQGRPPGKVADGPPALQLVDSHRRPGQRLRKYAILGEAPGDGPRVFAVRLHLEDPDEEVRARFVVVGVDPLWVYRHEDYEMMAHWECFGEERDRPDKAPRPTSPAPLP